MESKFTFGLASLILLVLLGCHKDKDILPENARLKQVLRYQNIDAIEPIGIEEQYEYNNLGQISKVSYRDYYITGFSSYDLYDYNSLNQLIKINNYYDNDTSFYQSNCYTYSSQGKKVQETIFGGLDYVKEYNLFFYTDERLSRIEKYSNGGIRVEALMMYTLFEFDDYGQPVREVVYSGFTNLPFKWTINTFTNGLNVKTVIYKYNAENFEDPDYMIREFKRTFDVNKNLKILEIYEGPLSSTVGSFVGKYIYFGE